MSATVSSANGRRRYRFLDLLVEVRSERAETLVLLDDLYGRFTVSDGTGRPDLSAHVRKLDDGQLRMDIDNVSCTLAPLPIADFHAYTILFGELLQRVGDQFFVHGAAMTDGAHTLILSGPSGHGKTTLSLALAGRGFRLLSDDFAPLGRGDGRVYPFPKRLGVRRGPDGKRPLLPPGIAGPAEWLPFGDKWLLDPGDLPGGVADAPSPLTHLLLLMAGDGSAALPSTYRLALVEGQAELERRLRDVPGVGVSPERTPGGRPALKVELSGGAEAHARFHEACAAHRHAMLSFEPDRPPAAFQGEPEITALGTLPAALILMREVLNRAPEGRLARESGGEMGPLVMELAGLLRGVRCASLQVGSLQATAERVNAWLDRPEDGA